MNLGRGQTSLRTRAAEAAQSVRLGRWTAARWTVAGTLLGLFVVARRGSLPLFRGTITFTETGSTLPLADPLAVMEMVAAGARLAPTVLLGAALLLVVAALLGPVFCGWVCPLGFLLDVNDTARRQLRRLVRGRAPARDRVPAAPGLRFAVLGAVFAFAVFTGVPLFVSLSPIRLAVEGLSTGLLAGLWVVAGLFVVEWLWPRCWCRLLCPSGALYALVGSKALLRVRIDVVKAGRTPCGMCTRHCGMGIKVMEDHTLVGHATVDDPACVRCGACIDHCPSGVLTLGWRALRGEAACRSR